MLYDINWLYDQQDVLCSKPKGEKKTYPKVDLSDFIPTPEKDPYFWIRQGLRPDLHREIYPNIPISLKPQREKESRKMELEISPPNRLNDPYYQLRKFMDPALHKQYYGE